MTEPPTKRARRTDSAAMWDRNDSTAGPVPQRSSEFSRDSNRKETEKDGGNKAKERRRHEERQDDDRRQSPSGERYHSRRERSRSRERSTKERDRARDWDRDRDRERARMRDDRDGKDRDKRGNRRARERSRSPVRHRSTREMRSERERDRPRRRSRSRSRSPLRNGVGTPTRTRSPPKAPQSDHGFIGTSNTSGGKEQPVLPSKVAKTPVSDGAMDVDPKPNGHRGGQEDEDSEDALLRKVMGFSTFKTTQNKKIPGNNVFGVRKEKSTKYRQYMNRTGGFNRPLSPSRD